MCFQSEQNLVEDFPGPDWIVSSLIQHRRSHSQELYVDQIYSFHWSCVFQLWFSGSSPKMIMIIMNIRWLVNAPIRQFGFFHIPTLTLGFLPQSLCFTLWIKASTHCTCEATGSILNTRRLNELKIHWWKLPLCLIKESVNQLHDLSSDHQHLGFFN